MNGFRSQLFSETAPIIPLYVRHNLLSGSGRFQCH